MCSIFLRFRGGTAVPLLAGASATFASARCGAFTFDMSALPSNAWLDFGSAFIYIMLVAGVAAGASALGGALAFNVYFLRRSRDGPSVPQIIIPISIKI